MKPCTYIKRRGMLAILKDCNYQRQNVKNHMLRETDVKRDKVYDVVKQIMSVLKQMPLTLNGEVLVNEVTDKVVNYNKYKGDVKWQHYIRN